MRKIWLGILVALGVAAALGGCSKVGDKVVVRITDPEGAVSPREITVGYVNDRLEHLPPQMVPDVPGEEGKKQFIEDVANKELLVIDGYRLGFQNDASLPDFLKFVEQDKAKQMFAEDVINKPAEPTDQDLERYGRLKQTSFELQQIVVKEQAEAEEAYRRVTEGGEDFGTVASEVSQSNSAADQGRMSPMLWTDLHPVTGEEIADLKAGDVTKPFEVGSIWHIYKVVTRKDPKDVPSLEELRRNGTLFECRKYNRIIREYVVDNQQKQEADLTYLPDALALASDRFQAAVDKSVPDNVEELPFEDRLALAHQKIIPEFSDSELAMPLLTYKIGNEKSTWTLGDFTKLLEDTPGIEAPKSGDPYVIKLFTWRKIKDQVLDNEIAKRGYLSSKEMADYVDQRTEEFIVQKTYDAEVTQKVGQPSGEDVRAYFQSHRENYSKPPAVDVQEIVVATEAEANLMEQRLAQGESFTDLVRKYSIDDWSKPMDGIIKDYMQGERKLPQLQPVVFTLDVGEISEPFEAPGGYGIAKVLAKYPSKLLDFKDVGDQVVKDLQTQQREQRLDELLDQLKGSVQIDWFDQNLKYVDDPAEVRAQKGQQTFTVRSSTS